VACTPVLLGAGNRCDHLAAPMTPDVELWTFRCVTLLETAAKQFMEKCDGLIGWVSS
jgi:hypothetical protein